MAIGQSYYPHSQPTHISTGMTVCLISNVNSGYNRKYLGKIDECAAHYGLSHIRIADKKDIETGLGENLKTQPKLLIINGGDGTVDMVLTYLRSKKAPAAEEPVLALLPGGTTNMIHRDTGFKDAPPIALDKVMALTHHGKTIPDSHIKMRVPLKITSPYHPDKHGFFVAMGALPNILKSTRRNFHSYGMKGKGSEILSFAHSFLKLVIGNIDDDPVFKPMRLRYCDKKGKADHDTQIVFGGFTTLDRLILGLRPSPAEDSFAFFALPYPYRGLLSTASRLLRGKKMRQQDGRFLYRDSTAIDCYFTGNYMIDGEPFSHHGGTEPLRIETDSPVRFLSDL